LTEQQTATLADRLKALADPTRLRMLDLLVQQSEPLCVCDMTALFAQNQPTISHHLKLLRQASLIETERRGIWAYYRPTDDGRKALAVLYSLT
jgi:ArsR family transcriptional regulator